MFYVMRDPVHNVEMTVNGISEGRLRELAEAGMEFYEADEEHLIRKVSWDEVKETNPQPDVIRIPIVTHQAFMQVMDPLIDALGALENHIQPVAVLSASTDSHGLFSAVKSAYSDVTDTFKRDFPDGYGDS